MADALAIALSVYHLHNGTWGSLHVVLDDGNIEDHHVDFCLASAQDDDDLLGEVIALTLREMTMAERAELILTDGRMCDEVSDDVRTWTA